MGGVEVYALRDLSLTIDAGDFVAIMGASGSGKSTLMHVLGMLDRPDSGEYSLQGKKVSHLNDEQRALLRNRLMGFVFQQFHLLPRMTAKQNVELPLIYAGNLHLHEKAHEKLVAVGLENRIDHRPNELSGGQQQRVAIARALVNDPLIIFADEPTGNLDSKSKDEIIQLLKKLNAEGKTIVMVTHEPEMAAHVKRVITMKDGQIISDKRNAKITSEKIQNDISKVETTESDLNASTGMQFFDYLRQAVTAMLAHKLRALLSILGIAIGVAAVIAMIALGRGAQESIQKQLASLGTNLLMLMSGSSKVRGVAMQQGSVTRFTFQDVWALTKLSIYLSNVAPSVRGRVQLVFGKKNTVPKFSTLLSVFPKFWKKEDL